MISNLDISIVLFEKCTFGGLICGTLLILEIMRWSIGRWDDKVSRWKRQTGEALERRSVVSVKRGVEEASDRKSVG